MVVKIRFKNKDPLALKLKDLLIFSIFALIFLSPLLLFVFLLSALDSGFPNLFPSRQILKQKFYCLKSEQKRCKKKGAVWAKRMIVA